MKPNAALLLVLTLTSCTSQQSTVRRDEPVVAPLAVTGKDVTLMSAEDVGIEIMTEMDREFHESTDRVIAVLGGAYLDSMLDKLFRSV